jgi:hypothetical protein
MAFVRDAGGEHIVEGGNTVGGDEQQTLMIQRVNVAHFSAGAQLEIGEIGLYDYGIKRFRAHVEILQGKERGVF